jgi:hypothetical protein
MIHNLVSILESVKLTVEALCRRDGTLLSAETMIFHYDQQFEHQRFSRLIEGIAFTSNESMTIDELWFLVCFNTFSVMQLKLG